MNSKTDSVSLFCSIVEYQQCIQVSIRRIDIVPNHDNMKKKNEKWEINGRKRKPVRWCKQERLSGKLLLRAPPQSKTGMKSGDWREIATQQYTNRTFRGRMADSQNHQAKRNARTAKWHLLLVKNSLPASLLLSHSPSNTAFTALKSKQSSRCPSYFNYQWVSNNIDCPCSLEVTTGVTGCWQLPGGGWETGPENNPLIIETGAGLSGYDITKARW